MKAAEYFPNHDSYVNSNPVKQNFQKGYFSPKAEKNEHNQ